MLDSVGGKIEPGSQLWVRGEKQNAWALGTVSSRKGNIVTVRSDLGTKQFDLEDETTAKQELCRANSTVVSDLTALTYFHVPGILHNLKQRSLHDEPYTFLGGNVLVVVNPLKNLSHLDKDVGKESAINSPHPHAISETAFQQLSFALYQGEQVYNQSVVLGGESGSGKTESSKYVLKHLVERAGKGKEGLVDRLLDTNPILEAFGNAATKRNPNSSRFGKFMKVHFDNGKNKLSICGASVETYLLERSRVTFHAEGERTYHVFYQMVNGADKELRTRLSLDHNRFDYLTPKEIKVPVGRSGRQSRSSLQLPDLTGTDRANFTTLVNALETIGLSMEGPEESVQSIFQILAGILHLGNIQFDEEETSYGDASVITNRDALSTASELLEIREEDLDTLFTQRKVQTAGETIIAQRDAESAKIALDAVVKAIYAGLFEWLVERINLSLAEGGAFDDINNPFIGILDIFGFETFRVNDFEQLLINYTNEALQKTFNDQVFKAEAALYRREGLLVDDDQRAAPPDNFETMSLLGGVKGDRSKLGILGILDAETASPQASDEKLIATLQRTFKSNELFLLPHPRDAKQCFIVRHYAGDVKYTTGKFIEKNVDKLPKEITEVLEQSELSILKQIFNASSQGGATAAVKNSLATVAGKFRVQIEDLVSTLDKTQVSFIRCIKPNPLMRRERKGDLWFNNIYVNLQLDNLSIPQTAEVLKGGLPTRIPFDHLIDSYMRLLPEDAIRVWKTLGKADERLFARALFYAYDIPSNSYKLGLTKVFFRAGMLDVVKELLETANGDAVPDEIVERFRSTFISAIGRRICIKLFAAKCFFDLHKQSSSRNSAITIVQRYARRRREVLEAQAQLEMLRKEKQRREEEESLRRAEQDRREAERLRQEQLKAQEEEERERLRLLEIEAEERAKEEEERAEQARLQEEETQRRLKQYKQEASAAKALEDKAIEEMGGETAFEEQVNQEKKKKKTVRFAVPDNEDDDEDDLKPRPNRPRSVAETNPEVAGIMNRAAERKRKSRAVGNKATYMNIDKPVLFEDVRYHEIPLFKPPNPFACFSALLGKKKKKSKDQDKSKGSQADIPGEGDEWSTCHIIIQGIELRYFKEYEINSSGEAVGIDQIGVVKIDPKETLMVASEDGDEIVEFSVRSLNKKILFRLLDAEKNKNLMEAYKEAGKQFEREKMMAWQFDRGDLDTLVPRALLEEYKSMLREELITPEEFQVLLNQQVTQEDEYLAADADYYGEETILDYSVICEECREINYVVPGSDVEKCHNCDVELPPSLEEQEREARAIRQRRREEEDRLERETKAGKRSKVYPFLVELENRSFLVVQKPTISLGYNKTLMSNVYRFSFDCSLRNDERKGDASDVWSFATTFEDLRFFAELLSNPSEELSESLTQEEAKKVPPFPQDVGKNKDKAKLAKQRLPLVSAWVLDLLFVAPTMPSLFRLKFVRRFFNLPLDVKLLSDELHGNILSLDQLRNILVVIDEVIATMTQTKKSVKKESLDLIRNVLDSLQKTADFDLLLTIDLPETEDKDELFALANQALNMIQTYNLATM